MRNKSRVEETEKKSSELIVYVRVKKNLQVDLFTKDAGEKTKEVIEGFKKVKKQKPHGNKFWFGFLDCFVVFLSVFLIFVSCLFLTTKHSQRKMITKTFNFHL